MVTHACCAATWKHFQSHPGLKPDPGSEDQYTSKPDVGHGWRPGTGHAEADATGLWVILRGNSHFGESECWFWRAFRVGTTSAETGSRKINRIRIRWRLPWRPRSGLTCSATASKSSRQALAAVNKDLSRFARFRCDLATGPWRPARSPSWSRRRIALLRLPWAAGPESLPAFAGFFPVLFSLFHTVTQSLHFFFFLLKSAAAGTRLAEIVNLT